MSDARDFTRPRQRHLFRVDDDVFEAAPALPAQALVDIASRFETFDAPTATVPERINALRDLFRLVLLQESFERFTARMSSPSDPIDLEQAASVAVWLLEIYGLRPTLPSGNSSDGSPSPASGTPSTATTSDAASISSPSPQTVS